MDRVVWISEKGKENEFIIVLISGGKDRPAFTGEFSHLGFAVGSKQDVDLIAKKGEADGILVWPVTEEPYPVGYYCGLKDPDGNFVEFSYGQPLGPGAKE